MKTCAILVPILRRAGNVAALVASNRAAKQSTRLVFICNHDDAEVIAAVRMQSKLMPTSLKPELVIVPWEGGVHADWARKLNHTWPLVDEEWRLHGADDIHFHPGWLDAALAVQARYDACVVGTNDLGNPRVMAGWHATHQLVHRDYWECGTIDEDGKVVTEVYHHNFVDDEFVQTAISRSNYVGARKAIVEHFHPDWGKAEDDETYRMGKSQFGRDAVLFNSRRQLWEGDVRTSRTVPVV